jgi:serine phosphatase RsbU (regulator of sigma subunit)
MVFGAEEGGVSQALRSLAVRLCAVGLVGALLAAAVLWSALLSFDSVRESAEAAKLISQAQRYHQDADMAHDALHADVLEVLRATEEERDPSEALEVLRADVADFRANVDRAVQVPVPAHLEAALDDLRPVQLAYGTRALQLGDEAVRSPATARPGLDAFQDEFGRLQAVLADVTEQLADAQATSQAQADRSQRRAERNILAAAALALVGLLALSGALAHVGRRLGVLLRRERTVAETLQRSLLPDRLPTPPNAELAARFVPSEVGAQVGGDWYDAFLLPGGGLGAVMGDVTGHDIKAASAMGQLRNALRAWSLVDLAPADLFDRLNELLFAFDSAHMATCVYLRLGPPRAGDDEATDTIVVELANAGHCPPLVVAPDGQVRLLEGAASPPLGAVPGLRYSQHDHLLARGSTVVLYTDGLIERRGEPLDIGLDRLEAAAADAVRSGQATPDALCDQLLARMLDGPADDDVALLAVTVGVDAASSRPGAGRPLEAPGQSGSYRA